MHRPLSNRTAPQLPWGDKGGALFAGTVMHARLAPVHHAFQYRVYLLMVDIDRIQEATKRLRLLSYNAPGLFSFQDKDHGPRTGDALRPWVDETLRAAGLTPPAGPVGLLSFPRLFGYVFNPISVFYCYGDDLSLRALIYEVNNTFGDTHAYVVPVDRPTEADRAVPFHGHWAEKQMHVSPFFDLDMAYAFRIQDPGKTVRLTVRNDAAKGPVHIATLNAARRPLTDGHLARLFATHPLMTVKVTGAIHWEAFRLWRKGVRYRRRPEPRPQTLSMGHRGSRPGLSFSSTDPSLALQDSQEHDRFPLREPGPVTRS
ncbi:MAG: DUF1365 domain-containing protein [Pseudomonadota bacterium]